MKTIIKMCAIIASLSSGLAFGMDPGADSYTDFPDNVAMSDQELFDLVCIPGNADYFDFLGWQQERDLAITDDTGSTLLHEAVWWSDLDAVRALSLHIPTDVQDNEGRTPLLLATDRMSRDKIQHLLDIGANPNIVGGELDQTPLQYAIAEFDAETALMLIPYSNLEVTDSDGNTAIQLAAKRALPDVVEALIIHGANTTGLTEDMVGQGFDDDYIDDHIIDSINRTRAIIRNPELLFMDHQ